LYINKESELLNELSKSDANFIRNTDIIINTDIVELIEQLETLMQKEGIESESGRIIEKIISKLSTIDVDKYYRIIFVESDFSDKSIYYAISDMNDFQIGDEVLIQKKNNEIEGIVREVAYYTKDNLPIPLNNMYLIKEITYRSDK
jgi:hypothetical protein